jgi:hypothetical protein
MSRRPPLDFGLVLLPSWKQIPASWLSCPKYGALISHPQNPSITLLPMKTPLPEAFSAVLGEFQWTVSDVHAYITSVVDDISSFRIVAINVASSNQVVTERDWESVGVKYVRVPVKPKYPKAALDQFIATCNEEATAGRVLFLVYSGKGLTRVSFCIAGYLAGSLSLAEAITDLRLPFFKAQPLTVLSESVFPGEQMAPEEKPDFLEFDEAKIQIWQVPLTLEKFKGVKKIARKEIKGDEVGHVMSFLPQTWQQHTLWNSGSMDQLRRGNYVCSFEPQAMKGYIVATSEKSVFLVDSRNRIWLLRAHAAGCRVPIVAYCYFVEDQRRAVALLCDLHRYGDKVTPETPLEQRLSVLSRTLCRKLLFDSGSTYECSFMYRPMARLRYAARLKKDCPLLFTRSVAIVFYSDEGSISLPIEPSLVLQFEYNGAGKAILLAAADDNSQELLPVSIYMIRNPKYIVLNKRTSRFEFVAQKNEWQPVTLGHDDAPATVREVQDLVAFSHAGWTVDTILDDIAKLKP